MRANAEVAIDFRPGIMMRFDQAGWRVNPYKPPASEDLPTLGVYGCSFTMGHALADAETYVALLQKARPDIRLLNRGVAGYGTLQSLLTLRDDIASEKVDAAIFTTISDHRWRNRATPDWLGRIAPSKPIKSGRALEAYPTAKFDRSGTLTIDYVSLYQPGMNRGEIEVFLPDEYMLDQVLFALLEEVDRMASLADLPIQFAFLDQVDKPLNALYSEKVPSGLDISVPYDPEHFFIPRNNHPNAYANQIYADRLLPIVDRLCSEVTS